MGEPKIIGRVLDGRYRIDSYLGKGGMATVYLAWHMTLERNVVVKLPKPALLEEEEFRVRFDHEIRKLTELSHPRIVAVLEAGEIDEIPYVVMEYLPGGSLRERLTAPEGGSPGEGPQEVLEWLVPMAEALDFVHAQGVVHRDVKPGNILFDAHGNPFLSDFGLAKVLGPVDSAVTRTGTTPGTALYMAPEAGLAADLTGAADQYSLGAIVYEALGGRVPIDAETPVAALVKKLNEDPEDIAGLAPALPPGAAAVVMRALARDPEERFPCCLDFARALEAACPGDEIVIAEEVEGGAEPLPVAEIVEPPKRGLGKIAALLAAVLLLGLGGYSQFGPSGDRGPRPSEPPESPASTLTGTEAILSGFAELAAAGIEARRVGDHSAGDIRGFLLAYGHFHYLVRALEGGISDEEQAWEREHLVFFVFLAGLEKGVAPEEIPAAEISKLRSALTRDPGPARLREHARRISGVGRDFERHLLSWLALVEGWVARQEGIQEDLQNQCRSALDELREACRRHRALPHERPEDVLELARALRDALSYPMVPLPRDGIEDLSFGVATVTALRRQLRTAAELAAPAGSVPSTVEDLLSRVGKRMPGREKDRYEAYRAVLAYLEEIIRGEPPGAAYGSSPDRRQLRERREGIAREIQEAGGAAWRRLQRPLFFIEGKPSTVVNLDGTPKPGWWDTLVDLSRARTADVLQAEYLERGLTPFLAAEAWPVDRPTDEKHEIYTVGRMKGLILPELASQESFFDREELAGTIRREAGKILAEGLRRYFAETEEFWMEVLRDAVPVRPAATLVDLRRNLNMWASDRSRMRTTCRAIDEALFDLRRLADDEDAIASLRAVRPDRERIFERFLVCFTDDSDRRIREAVTVAAAVEDLAQLEAALDPVAGGYGIQKARARELLAECVERGDPENLFAKALKTIRNLREEGGPDSAAGLISSWMEPGIRNGWDHLVQITADDINEEWSRCVTGWQPALDREDEADRERILGEGGEFEAFRRRHLEPFFTIPGYEPRTRPPGAILEIEDGIRELTQPGEPPDAGGFQGELPPRAVRVVK